MENKNYTQNWADSLEKNFSENKIPIPNGAINIVEIGSFEGRGTNILYKYLCNDSNSRIICVDPWEDKYTNNEKYKEVDHFFIGQYDRFINNTESIFDKLIIKKGYSNDIIPLLDQKIDFAYIDRSFF
jgi:hypothetical protein